MRGELKECLEKLQEVRILISTCISLAHPGVRKPQPENRKLTYCVRVLGDFFFFFFFFFMRKWLKMRNDQNGKIFFSSILNEKYLFMDLFRKCSFLIISLYKYNVNHIHAYCNPPGVVINILIIFTQLNDDKTLWEKLIQKYILIIFQSNSDKKNLILIILAIFSSKTCIVVVCVLKSSEAILGKVCTREVFTCHSPVKSVWCKSRR